MKTTNQIKRYSQVARQLLRAVQFYVCTALFLTLFAAAMPTHAASIAPSVPPVVYAESYEDLRVKVLGGYVVIQRTFAEGKWHPNYNWASLQFTFDSFDGSVKTITRGKAEYTKTAPGVFGYRKRDTIHQTSTGFRWQDRSGNWIEYDTQGQIQAYGDRNDVRTSFIYETVGTGKRISGIKDHLDNQVLWYEYTGDLLTAIRDYTNRRVEYQYNGSNQLTGVVDVNGSTWTYGYTGSLPTTFTDPENRAITRTWVGNGELASMRYADGTGVDYKYEYDSSKTLFYKQERTTGGRVAEFWINPDGEVVRQDVNGKNARTLVADTYARTSTKMDSWGYVTTSEYDQWDNEVKVVYSDGSTVTNSYDPLYSQLTQKIDTRGIVTKYEYDARGNLVRLIEALGLPEQRIIEYTYNQYGYKLTEKILGDSVTQEALTQYEYNDSYGNVTATVNPESYRTEYTYDVMGGVLTRKDANNKVWINTYNNRGWLKTEVDPLGHAKTYDYDKAGLRIKVTDTANNDTIYSYDARGNIVTITDPYGGIIRFEYNSDNQRTKQTDQEGRIQTTEYDLDQRLIKQIDGNGNAIQYIYGDEAGGLNNLLVKIIYPTFSQELKYDTRGRISEIVDVLDDETRYTTKAVYDSAGNQLSTTDKANRITNKTYDALGRLKTITDLENSLTEFTYDNRNNLINLKDPRGKIHRFTYDRMNHRLSEIRPLGQAITYSYSPTGQLESLRNPKGQVIKYQYDDAYKKVGESYYLTTSDTTAVKVISYNYNDVGNFAGYGDGSVQGTINYDVKQLRKIGENVNYGAFSLSYGYDYYANGLKKSFIGPDGVTVNYTYDNNNQLSDVQIPVGSFTVNTYQWASPAKITLPGGTTRIQSYDPLMRINLIQVKDPAQNEVLNYQYTYDSVDNIAAKSTEHGNYTYSYDNLYRLITANNPSPLAQEIYTYDAVGNRLTDANVANTWSYNDNNQLTSIAGVTYEYDANGNAIQKTDSNDQNNTQIYIYDPANRLIEVRDQNNALLVTYTYDPLGRRLSKETAGSSGAKTWFFYADEGLVAETDNAGVITKTYGYRPNGIWGTDPIYLKINSQYYFYQNDHLYTSQKLLNTQGAVVWSVKALAFGQAYIDAISTITNNFRFPGQYYDAETGLHYNGYRYYDPRTGRYITSDPIGLEGGINLYIYADDAPINKFDETGTVAWSGVQIDASAKNLVGVAGSLLSLTSACVNGVQASVKVGAFGVAAGFGGGIMKKGKGGGGSGGGGGFHLPGVPGNPSGTSAQFNDPAPYPDCNAFSGAYFTVGANISLYVSAGYSMTACGRAVSPPPTIKPDIGISGSGANADIGGAIGVCVVLDCKYSCCK